MFSNKKFKLGMLPCGILSNLEFELGIISKLNFKLGMLACGIFRNLEFNLGIFHNL